MKDSDLTSGEQNLGSLSPKSDISLPHLTDRRWDQLVAICFSCVLCVLFFHSLLVLSKLTPICVGAVSAC